MSNINTFDEAAITQFGWVDVNVDRLSTSAGIQALENLVEGIIPADSTTAGTSYATFDQYNHAISNLFSEWTRKYPKIFNEQYVLDSIKQIDKMLEQSYMPRPGESDTHDLMRIMQVQIPGESSFVFWNTIKFMMIIGGNKYFAYRGVQSKFLDCPNIKNHINNVLRPDASSEARTISEEYIVYNSKEGTTHSVKYTFASRNRRCMIDSVNNTPSIYNLSYQYHPSVTARNGVIYPIVDISVKENASGDRQHSVKWMMVGESGYTEECNFNKALVYGYKLELCSDRDSNAFVVPIAFYHKKSNVVIDCSYSIDTIGLKPDDYVQYINWCKEIGFKKHVQTAVSKDAVTEKDTAKENKQEQQRTSFKEDLEKLLISIKNNQAKQASQNELKEAASKIKNDDVSDPEVSEKHVCAGKCKSNTNEQTEVYLKKLNAMSKLLDSLVDFGACSAENAINLGSIIDLLRAGAQHKFPDALQNFVTVSNIKNLNDLSS